MELNLHGKNLFQARVALMSALKNARASDYRLRVIHGFQGGTALRDMCRQEFAKHPRVLRIEQTSNPGETIFILREY